MKMKTMRGIDRRDAEVRMIPSLYSEVRFKFGTSEQFKALEGKLANCLYFVTDTRQLYLGDVEYTRSSVLRLEQRPDHDTPGDEGGIYLCDDGSLWVYLEGEWTCLYDPSKVMHSITCGEGLEGGTITDEGTISHAVPEGASQITADISDATPGFGEAFTVHEVSTDKFGHVIGLSDRKVYIPGIDKLSTVLKYKGTVQTKSELPKTASDGDVYYVTENHSEYVYTTDGGWEELGPVADLSGVVPKVPGIPGHVAMFAEDGSLESAGYANVSGVDAGEYGANGGGLQPGGTYNVPDVTFDRYGRATAAGDDELHVVSTEFAVDSIAFIMEQYLGRM